MNRLVASVVKIPSGSEILQFCCLSSSGAIDSAISQTLLALIELTPHGHLDEMANLVARAKAGEYLSPNTSLPDFGVNDINLWLAPPMAKPACVCVTNENTEFAADVSPQQFSFPQVELALSHWKSFLGLVEHHGKSALLGRSLEVPFA